MTDKIGLTGSIATGKSTVADIFKSYNIPVVDADEVARSLIEPHKKGWHNIVDFFGEDILNEDQTINRKKLGSIVFSDATKLKQLNQINGKLIRQEIMRQVEHFNTPENELVIADIPLLFESDYRTEFDKVMLVYTDETMQLTRLMKRNKMTEKSAQKRVRAQWSIERKRTLSDIIINNCGTKKQTKKQIEKYLSDNYPQIVLSQDKR
ncbi:dephospho-CoA kinase [Holzapfeliella floricola]|uniref:Dephospho-CoA kinase n=1 Tax=Holzapfeliella floricola DSM 23037 = JCM 16512 TaxID=1423744 RepID=A0A0R2DII4_9LACO|nr:dephospho-CoA kinase [Holzapfeliella floricola]KRN03904.1 dephospho-CoA kinase [Holzapfeliella floricola DSM 23037 = JCM 16512]